MFCCASLTFSHLPSSLKSEPLASPSLVKTSSNFNSNELHFDILPNHENPHYTFLPAPPRSSWVTKVSYIPLFIIPALGLMLSRSFEKQPTATREKSKNPKRAIMEQIRLEYAYQNRFRGCGHTIHRFGWYNEEADFQFRAGLQPLVYFEGKCEDCRARQNIGHSNIRFPPYCSPNTDRRLCHEAAGVQHREQGAEDIDQ